MGLLHHCPECERLAIEPALDRAGIEIRSLVQSADGERALVFAADANHRNCVVYHGDASGAAVPRVVYGSPEELVRRIERLALELGFALDDGPVCTARIALREVS
jgi:hypothetical protein